MVKEEKENSFNSVELHLGVDASHSAPPEINHVITEAQRRELHHQVFIFNHLAYKLPPPHHRVQFPSNMSEYSFLGFDQGSRMVPEPHRCRRTDGKKWRCSKSVVPGQKYCERHMHRGRNRSRKPVETSQVNTPLAPKPCSKSPTKSASETLFEISNPNLIMAMQPSDTPSSTPSRSLSIDNCSSMNRSFMVFSSTFAASPGSGLASASAPKAAVTLGSVASVASDDKSCLKMCKKDNQSKSCVSNNTGNRSDGKGSIVGDSNNISTGISFSPTSVLQVFGNNPSHLIDKTNIESAPDRCRRTDGKKWQCKSAVLPGQKYCATHMHRGAKKRFANHEIAAAAKTTTTTCSAVTIARLPNSQATTDVQKEGSAIPSTNLSMSVPASAPFIQCNGKGSSNSDTDTTISDTLQECSYTSF
ncbi:growth-regulating factor 9-like [Vigna umbellata]|uniref:growth-regulating factor 9-like n=1 Tax=Vigna umbellata TaxID=87088 RepID=UPI001F5E87D8|nr:growth-regulating factor 9-like [Vigna umbellata]XP_047148006.1 growth-regulating factor 9-like [Vigna umbellata]